MDKKNMRLTFYVVCGLLLGAPYIWRLIKVVPEIFEKLPNAKEILSASGYAILVIASIVIAFKLGEALWVRIISIYSSVGLAVCIITMMTRALGASEIFEVLRRPSRQIADEVLSVLEETSPELVSDIARNGITLTGGSSQIWGMDLLLTERTGIRCTLADDPDSCVAYGCGKSLSWMNTMTEGPINIARRRMMRSI